MRRSRRIAWPGLSCALARFGLVALVAARLSARASAAHLSVNPDMGDLQAILDHTADGDDVLLAAGTYHGPLRIGHRLTLEGVAGTVIVGAGQGSVITVSAPGAVVRGLEIRGSGRSLETMDSGVFVEQAANGTVIENNRIEGNLFGIYLHGAPDALARGNLIVIRKLSSLCLTFSYCGDREPCACIPASRAAAVAG
jgi:nitrous oxidase accessory protein